jgi:serine/threonine-protein kinase
VAIKRLPYFAAAQMVECLRRETAALAGLHHPNILQVIELVADEEGLAIVMHLADGGPLLGRRHRLSPKDAMSLAAKMADALEAAHEVGIVHGDVKPSNILMDGDGEPLLSDFGLSRWIAAASPFAGGLAGTAGYLDPAVARGAPPSASSDVYSLGIMCYELLAGRLPYRGETPGATLRAADRGRTEPLGEVTPGVTVRLAAVVEQAMSRRPQARPATAGELAVALRSEVNKDAPGRILPIGNAAEGHLRGATGARPIRRGHRPGEAWVEPPEPGRRPRARLVAFAVVSTLVVGTLSGWALGHGEGDQGARKSCRAAPPGARDDQGTAGASTLVADVEGNGCVPVTWSSGVITVTQAPDRAPVRFALGQPGDQLLLGDWDCRGGAKPALYRPATGQVFYFPGWAEPGRGLLPSRERSTAMIHGIPRVAHGGTGDCDHVEVDPPKSSAR